MLPSDGCGAETVGCRGFIGLAEIGDEGRRNDVKGKEREKRTEKEKNCEREISNKFQDFKVKIFLSSSANEEDVSQFAVCKC